MSKMAPEMLALQRLYHWEKTSPNRVAFTQPMGGGVVQDTTWGEVANQVRRMANYLQSQGWEPGSKVAILSKNCSWWIMSDLAIWMAGYVSVPLYPTLAAATVHQILTHSEAKACFIGKLDGWEQMKPGVPVGMPCLSYPLSPPDAIKSYPGWEKICKDTPPLQGNRERGGDELATLIYTSGTTGMPKGVMHSFSNFAWALDAGIRRLPMGADDRMLSYLPLAHVVERVLVEHGWLRTGMQVFFADSLDTFAADLQRARPTIFFSVPRLWVKFQQGVHHKMPQAKLNLLLSIPILSGIVRRKLLKALGLDQCRIAAGGAAPMPLALLQWYSKIGLDINEGYGMTENLALSHITEPGKNQQGTVGPAYDGVEDRIDPENGEIQMRSPALMLGYYKEPEKTREAMTEDGWLRTGDKGRLDKQRVLSITGRVKDLFKTGKGKYVAPAPIEDKLMTHEAIEACVVTGANLGQPLGIIMLGADYQSRAADAGARAELEQSLAQHLKTINAALDPHERLQCLVVASTPWTVENEILTPTFKIKRNRIEELYAASYDGWESSGKKVIW
ncbi:AMP-binding protein [Candidatus Aalborgicola defluviihabitans]|jgi:long-chain acyl-CoA synthetase|uniref:AMP-binding protein n=1 Tax=Candidatus Aalborgicola defluviihabitans TaxID=3386187 RepID=UPI001D638EDF|nr:AMP-binding protein [Burkholderiales bacterium]MBK7280413.1 AMP-binding protein [Burkholderiales bacterium]MBK7313447.1 AMP-binding protein [Burkholderiales bacterium]MBL0244413.1 AMP-binding protein [Rhodoferax sp.]